MYINYEIMSLKHLSLHELGVLQLIKQNRIEPLSEEIKLSVTSTDILEKFTNIGYIEYVKGKKEQSVFELIRTTKKANDVLEDIGTTSVDEDSLKIYEWVKSIYLNSSKEIGNTKKCKYYISQFSKESGISRNNLAFLIKSFLNDEREFEFSQRMEYLFFKGASVFSVKFDINQSRLFQYYQKNEKYFDSQFQTL